MVSTTEKFNKDIEYGKIGEEKVYSFFRGMLKNGKPSVKYIMDVRDNETFQALDVDFIFEFNDGNQTLIEVKTDRQAGETGNLVFETQSNGNPGCLARSKADVLCYYVPDIHKLYYVGMKELKNYIIRNRMEQKQMGDNAMGFLISIADLKKYKIAHELDI